MFYRPAELGLAPPNPSMSYLGFELWSSGCSILRIKDQEGKRTVTYLAVIVVHWVMRSTWCALDAHEIRLLFLLPTSIIGRSMSWMSSCPSLPFLIQVQEITEPGMKYCVELQARCAASKPCIWTYFHWAFLSLCSQQKPRVELQKATFSSKWETCLCVRARKRPHLWDLPHTADGQADTPPQHGTQPWSSF